jgi:hypothetical protein
MMTADRAQASLKKMYATKAQRNTTETRPDGSTSLTLTSEVEWKHQCNKTTANEVAPIMMQTVANWDLVKSIETWPDRVEQSMMMLTSEAQSITMHIRANAGYLNNIETSANAA